MLALIIVVLAVSVVESRDRVRRDIAVDDDHLRAWYEARYARRGRKLDRVNLEDALRRAQTVRRWSPVALSAGTLLLAVTVLVFSASAIPGFESVWRSPGQILDLLSSEVLVETTIALLLLPILVVEGILAALYVADLDIGRLRRLLASID
jgi:hypothetical protein